MLKLTHVFVCYVRRVIDKTYCSRRADDRKQQSVRGCIVGHDIAVLNLVVTKIGDNVVPGLTDDHVPRRLGPKCANNIRKLFKLSKEDDVRQFVIARTFTNKKGITFRKEPKIQRLVTPLILQRKRARKMAKLNLVLRHKEDVAQNKKLVAQRLTEQKEARRILISKRRSTRESQKMTEAAA